MRTLVLLLLASSSAFAQTRISGRVLDEHQKSVPGANVAIKDTYDGASTDADGNFLFITSETGSFRLVVSAVGYQTNERDLVLKGEPVTLEVELKESITELNTVVITAGSFTASDQSRRTIFKSLDIATTAGATADIAGALNTLPGTQKVGERGRLFVRGGDGSETRTFIDGMVVLDAYGPAAPNTPSRGRFLPFMFKGTSFSTGGYSAEYGQALSSALVLDSKDEDVTTRTDIGLLSVGADVAHTQAWKNGSAAAKIQYTNVRPYFGLINQEVDWITPPASLEVSAVLRQRVVDKGLFKAFVNSNQSDFALYLDEIAAPSRKQSLHLNNRYRYGNVSYAQTFRNGWFWRSGFSYNLNKSDNQLESGGMIEREAGLHLKSTVEKSVSDRLEVKAGAEIIDREYSANWVDDQLGQFDQRFREPLWAAFVEADVIASKKWVSRAGARAEYNALNGGTSLDPRFSLAYKVGEGQVSFAYGRFRQSAPNNWLRMNPQLSSERAEHWIVNYQLIRNNRTLRVELYQKHYLDLVKFATPQAVLPVTLEPVVEVLNNTGSGHARGVEFFWRDNETIRNVDYWVSYSFLDTERDYLNYPTAATPAFASRHNFSFVYKHFVSPLKTQFGFTWSFASGRPFHNPNLEGFMQAKTPSYQDLSVNISYLPTPSVIVYFSCTNVLGYDNIFGYQYAVQPDANGVYARRAIRQPAPRFVFLGVFITLSKNKSVNQLPSL